MINSNDMKYIGGIAHDGLKVELNQDLEKRVMEHRNRFKRLIYSRYAELLPFCISYTNIHDTAINPVILETALRSNYNMVVGKAKNEQIMILGYCNSNYSENGMIETMLRNSHRVLDKHDINFTIPDYLIPDTAKEITSYDNSTTGNFVVLQNKPYSFVNDYEVIDHYSDELAEIVLSRFSLIMQSKFSKVFKSENNDETINQIINMLYNGAPFIKGGLGFDPYEQIIDIESSNIGTNLVELKREYQNKISELNNFLGINSLAVDKESGVSDTEAKSNRGFTSSNTSIYLRGRQAMDRLNKRFNLNILPYYNDDPISKLTIKNDIDGLGGADNEQIHDDH